MSTFYDGTAKIVDKVSILTRYVNDILLREDRESVIQLSAMLGEDVELKNVLGEDFAPLLAAIHDMTDSEGKY